MESTNMREVAESKEKYTLVEEYVTDCIAYARNDKDFLYGRDVHKDFVAYCDQRRIRNPFIFEHFISVFFNKILGKYRFFFQSGSWIKYSKFFGIKFKYAKETEKSNLQALDNKWLALFKYDEKGSITYQTIRDLYPYFGGLDQDHLDLGYFNIPSFQFYMRLLVNDAFKAEKALAFQEIRGLKLSKTGKALLKKIAEERANRPCTDLDRFFDDNEKTE
jgi:hypothetical protein